MAVITVIHSCCCSWGAGVKDEWPEFQCHRCPRHVEPFMAGPDDLCRRHRRERNGRLMAEVVVKAEFYTGGSFYQVRIMGHRIRDPEAYFRDIDFWLYTGTDWVRGRNARSGMW